MRILLQNVFKSICLFVFYFLIGSNAFSQFSGQNLDFSQRDFSCWRAYNSNCSSNTDLKTGWDGNPAFWGNAFDDPSKVMHPDDSKLPCFVLNSDTSAYDERVKQLKKIPTHLGYKHSARINAPLGYANASMLAYDMKVSFDNCMLTFNYALVMQAPDHNGYENPVFQIEIVKIDPSGKEIGRVDQCAFFEALGKRSNEEFDNYLDGIWSDWRQVSINLSAFYGENVRIKMIMTACKFVAHYAYGYIVAKAEPNSLALDACGKGDFVSTIIAPSGFMEYEWYENPTADPNYESITLGEPFQKGKNRLDVDQEQFEKCKNYVVKLTSPKMGAITSCLAYLGAKIDTKKPFSDFSYKADCQKKVEFKNETVFPYEDYDALIEYIWDFGDGDTIRWNSNMDDKANITTHNYKKSGKYKVRLSTIFDGCEDTKEKEIELPLVPEIENIDTTICIGTKAVLIANTDVSNPTFVWKNIDDTSSFTGKTYEGVFEKKTTLLLTVSTPDTECKAILPVTVSIEEFPKINIKGDTFLCKGQSLNLTALDDLGVTKEMQWSFNKPSLPPAFDIRKPITSDPVLPIFIPKNDTSIYLLARTSNGCVTYKEIKVSVLDPIAKISTTKSCPSEEIILTGENALYFKWYSNPKDKTLEEGIITTEPVKVRPNESTVYTMIGYGANDCFSQSQVKVSVIPIPLPNIYFAPKYINVDDPYVAFKDISKYGAYSKWEMSDGTTSSLRSLNHKFLNLSDSIANVKLITYNEIGCSDSISVKLPIELFSIWLPNTFYPSSNEGNNLFRFHSANKIYDIRFEIYNRWGKVLYSYKSPYLEEGDSFYGWNGKDNGMDTPSGIYVYRLYYKKQGEDRVYEKSGTINLIR